MRLYMSAVAFCAALIATVNVVSQEGPKVQTGGFVTFREALIDRHIELTESSLERVS